MKKKKMKFERKLMAFLLALVMVIGIMPGISLTVLANPSVSVLNGSGTSDDPYQISTKDDWDVFAEWINSGTNADKYYRQTDDISGISAIVGNSQSTPFKGSYDGNGYTIDAAIDGSNNQYVAPFQYADGSTIMNVKITGSVKGGKHCSGLVGTTMSSPITIQSCEVAATITATDLHWDGPRAMMGGFIGHGQGKSNTISDCLFSGNFDKTSSDGYYCVGVIYGWSGNNAEVSNCLAYGYDIVAGDEWTNGFQIAKGVDPSKTTNCFSRVEGTTEELVDSLGSGWVVIDNMAVPYRGQRHSAVVTFKVENGSWDEVQGDDASADITVSLTDTVKNELKLSADQIPAVGTKPNSGYEAGNWDVTPNTETEITADTVYTYTFASSVPSGDDEGGNTPGGDTPTPGGNDEGGNTPGGDTPTPSDSGEGGSDTPASDPVTPSGDEGTNGSQGTDGATGYVKDVTGTNEASGNYTFGQSIVNNGDLKTLLSLSDDEVSQGTKVWLDVADLGNNAPESDKALVESAKGDYIIGTYLDINLFKKVGNNEAVKVTKTNGNVEVSLVMPEDLRKEGRTYGIVRVHDDMATLIAASYARDSHALTFKTDGFSTYAIVYKDGTATGGNTPSNTSTSTDNSSSGSNNTTTTTTSTVVPKTDGMSGIMVWSLMLILSLSTLGVVAFMRVKENR